MYIRWSLYLTSASSPDRVAPGADVHERARREPGQPGRVAPVLAIQTVACIALLRAGLTTMLGGPPPDRRLLIAAAAADRCRPLIAAWTFPDPPTGGDISHVVFIAAAVRRIPDRRIDAVAEPRALLAVVSARRRHHRRLVRAHRR